MAIQPTVLWAQRRDRLFVSIQLEDIDSEIISVSSDKLEFRGKSRNQDYEVCIEFLHEIVPEESKQRKGGREYYFDIRKKAAGPYWPRLLTPEVKPPWLKVDFNRWKDEDDNFDLNAEEDWDDEDDEDLLDLK